jgi:hypothetical protein
VSLLAPIKYLRFTMERLLGMRFLGTVKLTRQPKDLTRQSLNRHYIIIFTRPSALTFLTGNICSSGHLQSDRPVIFKRNFKLNPVAKLYINIGYTLFCTKEATPLLLYTSKSIANDSLISQKKQQKIQPIHRLKAFCSTSWPPCE